MWMLFLSLGCEQGGDSFIFGTPCRGEQPGRVHGERGSEFEPLDFGGTFLSAPSPYATFKKGWLVGKHPRCSGCLGLGLGFAPGGSYCSLLCPLCVFWKSGGGCTWGRDCPLAVTTQLISDIHSVHLRLPEPVTLRSSRLPGCQATCCRCAECPGEKNPCPHSGFFPPVGGGLALVLLCMLASHHVG